MHASVTVIFDQYVFLALAGKKKEIFSMAKTKRSLNTGIGNKAYLVRFFDKDWEEITEHTVVTSNIVVVGMHIRQWSEARVRYEGSDVDTCSSLALAVLAQVEVT